MDERHERILDSVFLFVLPIVMLMFSLFGFMGYNRGVSTAWYVGFTNIFCAAILIVLPLMKRKKWFRPPYWFMAVLSVNVMMYGSSLFFGFYHYFWWWDELTHMLSSLFVAMIVFIALGVIEGYTERISLMPKSAFLLTVFLMGVAIGNAWEMFEGFVDFLVSSNHMQDIDAFDTLTDTTMDTVGAGIMTIIAAFILRKRSVHDVISDMGFDRSMTVMGKRWDRKCTSPDDPEHGKLTEEIDALMAQR